MKSIVFVSSNQDKFNQFQLLFDQYNIKLIKFSPPLQEIQSIDPKKVLEEKAKDTDAWISDSEYERYPWFVDDSCLFLDCLNGFPGPLAKSMYQAIGAKGFVELCDKYNNFNCTVETNIAFRLGQYDQIRYFSGHINGKLQYSNSYLGHGFEDVFVPDGSDKTFSEMPEEERPFKNMRGAAFKEMIFYLENLGLVKKS